MLVGRNVQWVGARCSWLSSRVQFSGKLPSHWSLLLLLLLSLAGAHPCTTHFGGAAFLSAPIYHIALASNSNQQQPVKGIVESPRRDCSTECLKNPQGSVKLQLQQAAAKNHKCEQARLLVSDRALKRQERAKTSSATLAARPLCPSLTSLPPGKRSGVPMQRIHRRTILN